MLKQARKRRKVTIATWALERKHGICIHHREVVAEHRVIQFEQMQLTSSRYLSLLWDLLRGYQTDRYASHLYLRHLDGYQACRLVRLADRQT